MHGSSDETAPTGLGRRLRAELGRKVTVLLGLAVGICVPYFSLQRIAWMPPQTPLPTPLDRAVPFAPEWTWVYASIALLVPLAPLMAETREELARYARGLALLCLACFAIFLLLPVLGPRPAGGESVGGLYALIVSVDRPSNSLPSLHAGLTLYSLLYGWRVLAPSLSPRGRALYPLGAATWTLLILYSTLATRQHWVVDLPAGMLIAWGAHRLAWRGAATKRSSRPVALPTS